MADFRHPANPFRNPNLWDTARVAGMITPGQIRVTNGRLTNKWDVWGGYGLSWATTVFTGIEINTFDLRLEFWEGPQFDEYMARLVPIIGRPPQGVRPKALSFYHPAVSLPPLNIRSVGIVRVTQPTQIDETGLWAVDIQVIPYQAPKPAIAKPIAADDTKPKPQDEWDRKNLEALEQIQQYAKE